ncbi:hypothetical protein MUQ_22556 [Vibrio harveyi CAIM 1792]|nr:hypothetical protein MUQ_22556 [Vibrio harveyi CAIM 1792]
MILNCLRVIRNAWHFHYAFVLVFKMVCGDFDIALLTLNRALALGWYRNAVTIGYFTERKFLN